MHHTQERRIAELANHQLMARPKQANQRCGLPTVVTFACWKNYVLVSRALRSESLAEWHAWIEDEGDDGPALSHFTCSTSLLLVRRIATSVCLFARFGRSEQSMRHAPRVTPCV